LTAIVRQESQFATELERMRDISAFERLVQAGYTAPMLRAHEAFLAQQLITALSSTNELVVARTPRGDWVCAFGSVEALRAHQSATPRQDAGGPIVTLSGAELVRSLLTRPQAIGVVFNPTPFRSGDACSTLHLTPADLTDLADRL
jgi:SseB protein N-terminal domain